nr:MAG: hypothetical protein DIU68_19475 [Chloroflexota bacterium]
MAERRRITHQFLQVTSGMDARFDRVYVPALMIVGIAYTGLQALQGDWLELIFFGAGVALFIALASNRRMQAWLLRRRFNRHHATHLALYWLSSAIWLHLLRMLGQAEPAGKASGTFYALLMMVIALAIIMTRSLLLLLPAGARVFASRIPLWEQVLLACNEFIAAGMLSSYLGGIVLVRLLQPEVFTTRIDPWYTVGVSGMLILFYLGMQVMWVQRWNDWLSHTPVWLRLARFIAPIALIVASLVIVQRFIARAEPRTADLLGDSAPDLAVLSIGAVVWLVPLMIVIFAFSRFRGLAEPFPRERGPPPLPGRVAGVPGLISEFDQLLIISLFSTSIPAYLFLLGDTGGVIGALSRQILRRGAAIIETTQQAQALLFALPFYGVALALLLLYAYVLSQPSVSAQERDELIRRLPLGFLIVLIITLYLFAVPVAQVLTEGRLPQLPQDLGRILAFNVLIPLALLYLHYFLFVRWPYGRGQSAWRERESARLLREQEETDQRIEHLNHELSQLDRTWHNEREASASPEIRFETLFRYVQLNSLRDDLNMRRLQIVAARQQLAEVSEAPVSIAVARLPLRIVSLGIPLLIAIQLYQWAIVNNGLREVVNTPNITVDEFFRIILEQINF